MNETATAVIKHPRISRFVRLNGTRDEQLARLRAQGWTIVKFKTAPVVVAYHEVAGKFFAKAWKENAHKCAWYYSFRSLKSVEEYAIQFAGGVAKQIEMRDGSRAAEKAKRAALKASDHYAVGDVLYNSWGYDQTNIDWYEVVELKPKSIGIRPIAGNYKETGFMSGHTQPQRGHYTGDKIWKPLAADGGVASKHGCFSKWDGKAQYESHYA